MSRFRFFIMLVTGMCMSGIVLAQELIPKSELVQPVDELLVQYQTRLENIIKDVQTDMVRDFVAIFANPNVKVFNNLDVESPGTDISIQNYCSELQRLYPAGVKIGINKKTIRIGKVEHDRGSRYLVPVKVHLTLTAFYNGKVYENKNLLIFLIAFNQEGSTPDSFHIYGISMPLYHEHELWVNAALSGSGVSAPWIRKDDRFNNKMQTGGEFDLMYLFWLQPGMGIGAGVRTNYYNSRIELDRMNSFMDKDPGFEQVSFSTGLYQLELPIMCYYKTEWKGRFNAYAGAGLFWSQRIWSEASSRGINSNYSITHTNIISDADWNRQFRKFFIGAEVHAGVRMKISEIASFSLEGRFLRALSSMDKNNDNYFAAGRYTGQYNPLWMDPDSHNYVQALSIALGVNVLLNKQE